MALQIHPSLYFPLIHTLMSHHLPHFNPLLHTSVSQPTFNLHNHSHVHLQPSCSRLALVDQDPTSVDHNDAPVSLSVISMVPLPPRSISGNGPEFWKQPDGEGYKPCLGFGLKYRRSSVKIANEKKRFLVVVVSGGLLKIRNQIVDAVVIARILEAALVLPVLKGDER